ncbi:MAG: LysR family transcriptional regulator [Candidatus Binatia bacterium]
MPRRIDTLTGMAVFASVAAAQSFSAAARELGLSKSAVSKHISQLEERLGARLLQRTTRRLSLTEAGTALYAHCRRIADELAAAEAAIGSLSGAPRGTLRVSAPMSFGERYLAPLLPAFLARHADLRVELTLGDQLVDLIEAGVDCAVRIARLPDSSLVARRLAPARRVVCGAPAYFERRGVPRTPDALRDHNCLDYAYLAATGGWPFPAARGLRAVPVEGNLAANNGEVLRAAALAGVGLALLPTFIVGDDLRAGRLRAVLIEYESWDASIYAVYPPTKQLAPKVRAFVDFLTEHCGAQPPWDEGLQAPRQARTAAGPRTAPVTPRRR